MYCSNWSMLCGECDKEDDFFNEILRAGFKFSELQPWRCQAENDENLRGPTKLIVVHFHRGLMLSNHPRKMTFWKRCSISNNEIAYYC